jgi:hypothetical protein
MPPRKAASSFSLRPAIGHTRPRSVISPVCFPKIASGLGSRREAESSHDWGRSRFWSLGHGRRQLLWFEVTRHPTAEWLARQITEAFPWA